MNLYNLHPHPETLSGYNQRLLIPEIAYEEAIHRVVKTESSNCVSLYPYTLRPASPDLEPAIAKHAKWAFFYANNILNGRFELGEPTIARDGQWAYMYALYVIKGRWEIGEEAIFSNTNPQLIESYQHFKAFSL